MLPSHLQIVLYHHEIALREIAKEQQDRVQFIIVHRHSDVPGRCTDGEFVEGLWLIWGNESLRINLSTPHLLLFNFLCSQKLGRGAIEIVEGLTTGFYLHHGANAPSHRVTPSRSSRTSVKKQVERIRESMGRFFELHGIELDPSAILLSEPTSTREVKYRIEANVTIEHPDW